MGRAAPAQTSFSGGEFSPTLYGRFDAERQRTGLATCLNYIPTVQGPLWRRTGTRFAAETAVGATKKSYGRLYERSDVQAFRLEFSDLKLRFWKDRGAITESAQTITGATQANPVVVTTSGSHGYSNGDEVDIDAVVGMTELNERRFTVANVTATTFQLQGVDGTAYTAYASGGTAAKIYTLTSPYAEADIPNLKIAQSNDVLYIAHKDYAPRKLEYTSDTSWALSTITFIDGPYLNVNSGSTTITPSVTTGSGTLTASAALFSSTDVGRLVRLQLAGSWGYCTITGYTSATVVNMTVNKTLGGTTATAFWRLGLWSDTTGYPAANAFHGDRLVWGGGPTDYPQRVDGSQVSDYENMAPTAADGTVVDSDAYSFTLNSRRAQPIRWLTSDESGLFIGTASAEWLMRPSSLNEAITPTNVDAKVYTRNGSNMLPPIETEKATIFVDRSGRRIRELLYSFASDSLSSPDLNKLSGHITEGGIVAVAYQQLPQPIVWAVRDDGVLLSCTYERDDSGGLVAAWARHTLGGYSDAGKTAAPVVEDVSVIPSPDGTREDVWLTVKRYVNGAEVRYTEYIDDLEKPVRDATAQEDMFFNDCGSTYDGAATSSIGGLWHLEGETLTPVGDGAVMPDVTVANGTVTLSDTRSVVHLGYAYNSDGQMMRVDAGAADGTAIGKLQRSDATGIMLHRSLGLKLGLGFDDLTQVYFRGTSDAMDTAVPLFSGIVSEKLDGSYDTENQIAWRQDQPLPSTVLAIMPRLVTRDAA